MTHVPYYDRVCKALLNPCRIFTQLLDLSLSVMTLQAWPITFPDVQLNTMTTNFACTQYLFREHAMKCHWTNNTQDLECRRSLQCYICQLFGNRARVTKGRPVALTLTTPIGSLHINLAATMGATTLLHFGTQNHPLVLCWHQKTPSSPHV